MNLPPTDDTCPSQSAKLFEPSKDLFIEFPFLLTHLTILLALPVLISPARHLFFAADGNMPVEILGDRIRDLDFVANPNSLYARLKRVPPENKERCFVDVKNVLELPVPHRNDLSENKTGAPLLLHVRALFAVPYLISV